MPYLDCPMPDTALYLAARIRDQYPLSFPATADELVRICEERGCYVFWLDGLKEPGYFMPWPYPVISLRLDADCLVIAHELAHLLLHEGEGIGAIYMYSEEETVCRRFARLLCSPD